MTELWKLYDERKYKNVLLPVRNINKGNYNGKGPQRNLKQTVKTV